MRIGCVSVLAFEPEPADSRGPQALTDCISLRPCVEGLEPFGKVSMDAFTQLFHINNPQIVENKRNRFVKFLHATADGTLFERPSMEKPAYVAHLEYASPPIWGATQSSYEDVEKELNIMRVLNILIRKFCLWVVMG